MWVPPATLFRARKVSLSGVESPVISMMLELSKDDEEAEKCTFASIRLFSGQATRTKH